MFVTAWTIWPWWRGVGVERRHGRQRAWSEVGSLTACPPAKAGRGSEARLRLSWWRRQGEDLYSRQEDFRILSSLLDAPLPPSAGFSIPPEMSFRPGLPGSLRAHPRQSGPDLWAHFCELNENDPALPPRCALYRTFICYEGPEDTPTMCHSLGVEADFLSKGSCL